MPCYGPSFGFAFQRLVGIQQRFMRSGLPTYLRLKNFDDVQEQPWSQLGFEVTPVGGGAGTIDILIDPPPATAMVSTHNIGMSVGKLRFGARTFTVSQEFVAKQMAARGLSEFKLVWTDKVVGLITENQLFSIEDIKHRDISSVPVLWVLTANTNELR